MSDLASLATRLQAIRGNRNLPPEASVVIPVNAKADLGNVVLVMKDISHYHGSYRIEIILIINNYPPESPPAEIEQFSNFGVEVIAVPDLRRQGEFPGFTGRYRIGVPRAKSDFVILFDADCRIPDAHALLSWYVAQAYKKADVAYTHVAYFDFHNHPVVWARLFTHHGSRWIKRNLLGIPTTRGSNYAIRPSFMLPLLEEGYLADEMNAGPTAKSKGGRVVYSGKWSLRVVTSGRYFQGSWGELVRYLIFRLRYNIRVLPVRKDAVQYTNRIHKDLPKE